MYTKWQKNWGLLAFGLALIIGCLFFTTAVQAAGCGGVETSIIDCSSAQDTTGSPVVAILVVIIQILTGLVGIVAIGAFIYAGIMYSSAGGESGQIAKAKEIIFNTVIGLVVFAAMALVLNYLIPGGLFSGNAKLGAGGNGVGDSTIKNGSSIGGGGNSSSGTPIDPSKVAATFDLASYNILGSNVSSWNGAGARSSAILGFLKTVDVAGIQEGREESIEWLTPRMESAGYDITSNKWARNVFWKTSKFTKLKESEIQVGPGKDLVWVKLREKTSSKVFYVADIHLDVTSSSNRLTELRKALPYMKSSMSDAPIIFVGDMNSERGSAQDKLIKSYGFKDAYDIATTKKNMTYRTTLKNYNGGTSGTIDTTSNHQIDHIYVNGSTLVSYVEIKAQKGSDHLPVKATIVLSK